MFQVIAALLLGVVSTALAMVFKHQRAVLAGDVASAVPAPAAPAAARPVDRPAPTDPVGRIVEALRTRAWARRGLSLLSFALLAVAVGMLGYPVYTNWYAEREQGRLERELASPELQQQYRQGALGEGDALTRIRIPKLDIDTVVVEGVGAKALRAGAGHYPKTPLPCEAGNVGIAGHRTTYGRPFHNLDLLEPGDVIILETPVGSCTYEVAQDPWIVAPSDTSVVDDTPGQANLTLTTCHPKGSARQRLIVRATMVSGTSVAT